MPIFNGLQYHHLPNLGRDGHINESVVKLHIFVGIFTPMTGGAYFSNGLVKNHQLVKLDHHGLQTGGTQYEQKLPLTRLTIFLMVFHVGGIAGFLTSLKNRLPSKSTLLRTNISQIEKAFFVDDFPLEPKVGHGDLPSRQQGYDFCGRRSQHWWSSQGEGFWSKIGLLFVKKLLGSY